MICRKNAIFALQAGKRNNPTVFCNLFLPPLSSHLSPLPPPYRPLTGTTFPFDISHMFPGKTAQADCSDSILYAKKGLEENYVTKRTNKFPILSADVSLVDSHCHLDMNVYRDDLDEVIARAVSHGVAHTVTIGIDLDSSRRAIQLARQYSCLSATVGVHPHDVADTATSTYDALAELADKNREYVVGYGEIGLDYVKEYSPADIQRRQFADQLALARDLRLPVIVHDREAHEDTLRILQESGIAKTCGGVMHCFSGDLAFARRVIDLGFYVSLPGVVTFKSAVELQEVATSIPLESMLVETDGPYLAPHPVRGRRNEPANVLHTAAFIANLRQVSLDEVAKQTTANACALFQLPPPATRGQRE